MILDQYKRAFDVYFSPRGTGKMETLTDWHRRCQAVFQAAEQLRSEIKKEEMQLLAEYSVARTNQLISQKREAFNAALGKARESLQDGLKGILDRKRAELVRRQGGISSEVLNLLQVLQMRQHLTAEEVITSAEVCRDNIPALALLSEIASRHGINMPHPDVVKLTKNLDEAETLLSERLESLSKPLSDQGYIERLFWQSEPGGGQVAAFVQALDENQLTAVKVEPQTISEEQPAETAAE